MESGKIKLRVGLCDDLAEDRQLLLDLLNQRFRTRKEEYILTAYSSAESLLSAVEEDGAVFDLLFLDIYMEGISGIEAARRLRERDGTVSLIFITTSPDFALESYEVFAMGYLLKPPDGGNLDRILDRFFSERVPRAKNSLLVLDPKKGTRVPYRDIMWIESCGHVINVYRAGGPPLRFYTKLSELETELSSRENFLRCHQSCIVNLDYVQEVDSDFVLTDGTIVPIRAKERRRMKEIYYQYFIKSSL